MLLFVSGILTGTIYSSRMLPEKEKGIPSLKFTVYPIIFHGMIFVPVSAEFAIHVHHWVIYTLLFVVSIMFKLPYILIGFCVSMVLHGLSYADRFSFVEPNPFQNRQVLQLQST